MIVLFTDFGLSGPYVGQLKAVLHSRAPGIPVIDLFSDAPAHDPRASAYLLSAYCQGFGDDCVFLAVIDPGVGGARRALAVRAGARWFVGPDNGLFEIVIRRAADSPADGEALECWEILWRPENLSASFHGRDVFAPIAAKLARREYPVDGADFRRITPEAVRRPDWPDDLNEAVYIDRFGNVITGLRAVVLPPPSSLTINGRPVPRAKTFSEVSPGGMFCYENANGLLEVAVNGGRADKRLGIEVGDRLNREKG